MKDGIDLYRVELYVLDLNGQIADAAHVKAEFQNMRYLDFVTVTDVKSTIVPNYNDDHHLNKTGCDFSPYFPDVYPGVGDEHLKREYQRVRTIMLNQINANHKLEADISALKAELAKLNNVKEFVNGLKEKL